MIEAERNNGGKKRKKGAGRGWEKGGEGGAKKKV